VVFESTKFVMTVPPTGRQWGLALLDWASAAVAANRQSAAIWID
jgi:hypothetical protein